MMWQHVLLEILYNINGRLFEVAPIITIVPTLCTVTDKQSSLLNLSQSLQGFAWRERAWPMPFMRCQGHDGLDAGYLSSLTTAAVRLHCYCSREGAPKRSLGSVSMDARHLCFEL